MRECTPLTFCKLGGALILFIVGDPQVTREVETVVDVSDPLAQKLGVAGKGEACETRGCCAGPHVFVHEKILAHVDLVNARSCEASELLHRGV